MTGCLYGTVAEQTGLKYMIDHGWGDLRGRQRLEAPLKEAGQEWGFLCRPVQGPAHPTLLASALCYDTGGPGDKPVKRAEVGSASVGFTATG